MSDKLSDFLNRLPVVGFFLHLSARWLAALRRLFAEASTAYSRDGLRAALFEVELRARVFHALLLGAPLIFDEMIELQRESRGLLAAWRDGLAPEAYVRRKCEALGICIGSPTHVAILSWAWATVNHWEARRG
ncbi:MAG: hypothetical protein H7Z38_00295 [Rubrivivax sp.]|nr:hypothetical protein [Pyrinomonadaceae bacterium]